MEKLEWKLARTLTEKIIWNDDFLYIWKYKITYFFRMSANNLEKKVCPFMKKIANKRGISDN